MRKLLVLGAVAALLAFLATPADAQRVDNGNITYSNGKLMDADGHVLTDYEVMDIIGRRTYNETYNGAVQQYKAGKGLVIGGAIAAGLGTAATIGTAIYLGPDRARSIYHGFEKEEFPDEQTRVRYVGETTAAAAGLLGGVALASVGQLCLAAGIPLLIIGHSRLTWVAEDHNAQVYRRERRPFIDFSTEDGPGIRLNF